MKNKSWLAPKHWRVSRSGIAAFVCIIFAVLLQTACGSHYVYKERKQIANSLWTYRDTVDFRFEVPDTSKTYNLFLDVEYADSFPTQNLYLRLHTLFPDGKRLAKQKSVDLFDARGAALGACSGQRCKLHMLLQEHTYFNDPGTYVITLEQYSRHDSLPGIYAIGMAMEEAAKPK